MSVDPRQIRDMLGDRLTDLDGKLGDDVRILAELQLAIKRLVDNDEDAGHAIRRVLQERLDRGDLRHETFELVRSMLDKSMSENVPTIPGDITYESNRPPTLNGPHDDDFDDDKFSSTTVLPTDIVSTDSPDDRIQVGSVLRDRFLLQTRVAGGSMGVVYKALDRRLAEAGAENPFVAIKVLSPKLAKSGTALRALQQEAAKGRWLTHPNIVRFLDLDRDDDLYFIVLEWLEGQTLAAILDSDDGRKFDVDQSLQIVQQIGRALEYAHRCGIVHADVKPGNIMMMPDGEVKLFDFGVARVLQTQESSDAHEHALLRAATPAYSSMQVLTGEEPTASDDVFSLGCLLYRLIAGYRVFGPRNAAEAAAEGMQPQRLEALSDTQWKALRKAISFARVARFESVTEFIDALNDPSGVSLEIEPDPDRISHAPKKSRSKLPWALGAIAALLAAAWYYGGVEQARLWFENSGLMQEFAPIDAAPTSAADIDTLPASTSESEPVGEYEFSEAPEAESAADETVNESLVIPGGPGFEPIAPFQPELVTDFSSLPPADIEMTLARKNRDSVPVVVTLREDNGAVTVDLLRTDSLDFPLKLRIEEVSYSGNRSPWRAGQYSMSEDPSIEIPAGQDRVRLTFTMASDPLREADQQSTLRIRPAENTRVEFGILEIILEDDDQRAFESELPPNTVGFAVSQVSVRERDPAAQVDVLRFNPDDEPVVVGYMVRDITATEGEDYFAPSGYSLSFGPGQRSARLLVPLVQDSLVEGDEAFTVELSVPQGEAPRGVFQRIVIVIRDDDIAVQ